MGTFSKAFVQSRIDYYQTALTAAETALAGIIDGSTMSYTIDTGQSKTTVTSINVSTLQNHLDWLAERLEYWANQLPGAGAGATHIIPGW